MNRQFDALVTPSVVEGVRAFAKAHYPKECCGFFVLMKHSGRVSLFPVQNEYEDPTQGFRMPVSAESDAEKLGSIIGMYHSHPDESSQLSDTDYKVADALELPSLVVAYPAEEVSIYIPQSWVLPYEGRPFIHGTIDCFALGRDYYKREFGIEMFDHPREDDWWKKGQNLYLDNFEKYGFVTVGSPKVGDVILMQVLSNVPNHIAIYLGGGIILHHLYGRLSCKAPMGSFYEKNTYAIYRHSSQC